jgi:hypothetical protein
MPSPYASQYDSAPRNPAPPKRRKGREQAEAGAGLLRMLGQAAPMVGTAAGGLIGAGIGSMAGGVGAIPGATLGSGIGGALGGALGGAAGAGAGEMERPYADDDLEAEARRRLTMDVLSRMRR